MIEYFERILRKYFIECKGFGEGAGKNDTGVRGRHFAALSLF
jgi:hypothetical protein